jgi:1-deoxy-D-xylulose 5-phosphate reductoisomerase
VEKTLAAHRSQTPRSLEQIVEIDQWARKQAEGLAA